MLSANTVAQNPAGSVIPLLSSAQTCFVVVGCCSRAANSDPVAGSKPIMSPAERERRDSKSAIRIGFVLLRSVSLERVSFDGCTARGEAELGDSCAQARVHPPPQRDGAL